MRSEEKLLMKKEAISADKIENESNCMEHGEGSHTQDVIRIAATSILLLGYWLEWLPNILGVNTALLAAIIGGLPIIKEAVSAIYRRGDTKVGLLVSIAIIASIAIGEYFAAAEVALIMTIGEMLEHITLEKSNTALKKLADLAPLKARILEGGSEREIAAELVKVGDILLVKPGEKIPVDGMVTAGHATVDQATITGESIPVECHSGVNVFGGTIVAMGSIEIVATKVGQDTALGHIIKMVKEAQASKAPSARIIDTWANWFVPLSLAIAVLVYLVTGDIVRGVTILIVFCPCAMLLSTPTAVAAAIGAAARRGILIKGGEILERVGSLDTVVFDKTGTITLGKPFLKDIRCYNGWQRNQLLAIAAGIEKRSEHHLAKAIIQEAEQEGVSFIEPMIWEPVIGQGIVAKKDDEIFLLGNQWLIKNQDIMLTREQEEYCIKNQGAGATVVFIAVNGDVVGIITIQDPIREGAKEAIEALQREQIKKVVLLTGDSTAVGNAVGAEVNIPIIHGDLLPDDKVKYVETYQREGFKVAMLGDGINDAPALAKADIGIAMGYSGTDIAIEAADIVLLSDDLNKISETIQKSRKAIRTIWQNIVVANVINFAAIILAALGLLGPVAAAIVHNVGAILVVLNSARLLRHE
ncbi:cation-translocating P-type ATPase [Pelosinus sp. IPA-1]|uniref:heavy metal translocating P-type ATPase n=1 Tax=Pelosinus sp. IPA-1 TaxID=3029569 RepID=UPI0024361EAE|nr:cation-translocating P-type ATPase [Pelosinus sp. IPA-1]GMB01205.1 copper-translocating P-type ATPase [Pelosinus sp. IPA-1]